MEFINRHQKIVEVLIILLLFVVVSLLCQTFQQPITYNEGRPWDGESYYSMAEQFSQGQLPEGKSPFIYRFGTPFLASLIYPDDLMLSFKLVNVIANIISTVLLIIWLRLYIRNWMIRTLLVSLFLLQWHAPVRNVFFFPVNGDPWIYVFLLGGLIAVHKTIEKPTLINTGIVGLISIVGVLFREYILIIPIVLLFGTRLLKRENYFISPLSIENRPPVKFIIPLLLGIAGLAITHLIVSTTVDYSFIRSAGWWTYDKQLLTYVLAWFIAFGPLFVIAVYDWRNGSQFLANHQFLFAFLIITAIMAWIGGSDTERFLYWSMPVIYVLIGKALENNGQLLKSALLIIVLVVTQCISQRIFWTTPDYAASSDPSIPILTPIAGDIINLDLTSYHGDKWTAIISCFEYVCLGILIILWLNYRAGKKRTIDMQ